MLPDATSWPFLSLLCSWGCWAPKAALPRLPSELGQWEVLEGTGRAGGKEKTGYQSLCLKQCLCSSCISSVAPAPGSRMLLLVMPPPPLSLWPWGGDSSPTASLWDASIILSLASQWFHHLYNQLPILKSLCLKDLELFLFYYHSVCCWCWIFSFCILWSRAHRSWMCLQFSGGMLHYPYIIKVILSWSWILIVVLLNFYQQSKVSSSLAI